MATYSPEPVGGRTKGRPSRCVRSLLCTGLRLPTCWCGPYSKTDLFIPNEQMGKLRLREGSAGFAPSSCGSPRAPAPFQTGPQPQEAKLLICSSKISLTS